MNPIILRATTLIKGFEGCRLHAYQDSGAKWTIGYGSLVLPNNAPAHEGATITQTQADDLLAHQVGAVAQIVQGMIEVPATNSQQAALVSLCFNIGSGNLRNSTLMRLFNAGRTKEAAAQFAVWTLVKGHQVSGLINRRAAERAVFCEGAK